MPPEEFKELALAWSNSMDRGLDREAALGLARSASTEGSHWHLLACLLMPRTQSGRLLGMASPDPASELLSSACPDQLGGSAPQLFGSVAVGM